MIAQLPAHLRFQVTQVGGDLVVQPGGQVAFPQVMAARVGADDKPGWNGQTQVGHLS